MQSAIDVSVSPKQISKLKKGLKVRVKPPIEGEGFALIVNPRNYSLLSKSFARGKGSDVVLSAEELDANMNLSPEQHQQYRNKYKILGKGIFGKTFDRGVAKLIGKNARREIYKLAEQYKPLVKGGITAGLTAGAASLGCTRRNGGNWFHW